MFTTLQHFNSLAHMNFKLKSVHYACYLVTEFNFLNA